MRPDLIAEQDDPVLAISGRTRAGKTTLARALSEALGWPGTSFSSWIREEASRRELPNDRRTLQDLGAQLIEELGWDVFCRQMLQHANLSADDAPFIVEGLRHLGTLVGLRRVLAPVPVVLVHLDVSDKERLRRLESEGVDQAEAARWERHSTEIEVINRLPEAADLVVDADLPANQVANTVIAWLGES